DHLRRHYQLRGVGPPGGVLPPGEVQRGDRRPRPERRPERGESTAATLGDPVTPKKKPVARSISDQPRNGLRDLSVYQGGEGGCTSSYSEGSSALPSFAGTITRSSSISALVKVLRNLVTNCPSFRCPANSFSAFRSSAGASRTR